MSDTPTIHQAMNAVMKDIGAIGKNRQADQRMGGYKFRGIDDVYNALHKPLAEHGVFFVPEVTGTEESTYKTSGGAEMRLAKVYVTYRFYGPAGDCIEAPTVGEAADTGDKALNKALTAALKYLLFQVFCIAVEGDEDADAQSPELTGRAGQTRSSQAPSRPQGTAVQTATERQVADLHTSLRQPSVWDFPEPPDEASKADLDESLRRLLATYDYKPQSLSQLHRADAVKLLRTINNEPERLIQFRASGVAA